MRTDHYSQRRDTDLTKIRESGSDFITDEFRVLHTISIQDDHIHSGSIVYHTQIIDYAVTDTVCRHALGTYSNLIKTTYGLATASNGYAATPARKADAPTQSGILPIMLQSSYIFLMISLG